MPDLIFVYGPEGVGKTTWASQAIKPYILDLEKGSRRIPGVQRYDKAETLRDAEQFLADFIKDPKGYQTLVVDSTSELERMIWKQACIDNNWVTIEDPGYGKGYVVVMGYWENFFAGIQKLQRTHSTNVIFIGHSEMKNFTDPKTNSSYDRYQAKLDKRAYALFRERMDFIGFADYVTHTKGKESDRKHKAFSDGTRKLYTERRPAFDAKNRLGLPLEMDFDYSVYAAYAHADEASKAKTLRDVIVDIVKQFKDEKLPALVADTVKKAGDNVTDLTLIKERLLAKLEKESSNGLQQ